MPLHKNVIKMLEPIKKDIGKVFKQYYRDTGRTVQEGAGEIRFDCRLYMATQNILWKGTGDQCL